VAIPATAVIIKIVYLIIFSVHVCYFYDCLFVILVGFSNHAELLVHFVGSRDDKNRDFFQKKKNHKNHKNHD
jgi:hypothetical protein